MAHPHLLPTDAALPFLMAGNATVTVLNTATQGRFTFAVQAPWDKAQLPKKVRDLAGPRFVRVMTGPSNESDYRYLGMIGAPVAGQPLAFKLTAKSTAGPDAPSVKAFSYILAKLQAGTLAPTVEVWHEGKCGMCGKKLTVPESIERGIGPECFDKMGGAA